MTLKLFDLYYLGRGNPFVLRRLLVTAISFDVEQFSSCDLGSRILHAESNYGIKFAYEI